MLDEQIKAMQEKIKEIANETNMLQDQLEMID